MTTKAEDIELRKDVVAELEWDPSNVVALTGHVDSVLGLLASSGGCGPRCAC